MADDIEHQGAAREVALTRLANADEPDTSSMGFINTRPAEPAAKIRKPTKPAPKPKPIPKTQYQPFKW